MHLGILKKKEKKMAVDHMKAAILKKTVRKRIFVSTGERLNVGEKKFLTVCYVCWVPLNRKRIKKTTAKIR